MRRRDLRGGPLEDLDVLDLSQILSGPYCTMLLADLGARVIKIEPPGGGDRARRIGPPAGQASAYFASVNRGKRSVALDLGHEEGRSLILRMCERCDVLVENFRPGRMRRLGLDPQTLLARNPRLVYASITGFGQTGPYASRPALDIIVQALGGLMSVTGEPGGPPVRAGASLGDSVAGLFAAVAILAALHERERTGKGRWIDMAMLDGQISIMENAFARYFATGEVPRPMGSRHPALTPFQAFAAADGHLVVALLHDDRVSWGRLCQALGLPDLAQEARFADGASRTAHYEELAPVLEGAFRRRGRDEWIERLAREGIPCAPVLDVSEVARDPHVRQRGMLVEIPGDGGSLTVANTPFRFENAPTGPQGGAPLLGEHTEEVLRDLLGLEEAELERLDGEGAIAIRRRP